MKVMIISSSPIYAHGLQKLVEASPINCCSEILLDPAPGAPLTDSRSDALLVAPWDWRELGIWISPLRKHLHETPWVVLATLPTIGLFMSILDAQPCVVLDAAGTPDDLSAALRAAVSNRCWHLPTTLLSRFMRSKVARLAGRSARTPSITELAICCGVSLGLSNSEIGDAMHVSEATVKTHLHRLTTRMGLDGRAELGDLVVDALSYEQPAPALDANGLSLTL